MKFEYFDRMAVSLAGVADDPTELVVAALEANNGGEILKQLADVHDDEGAHIWICDALKWLVSHGFLREQFQVSSVDRLNQGGRP